MHCNPPDSSVQGSLQVRTLEWVAMPSSRGSSPPRDPTRVSYVSCVGRQVLHYQCHPGSPNEAISWDKWQRKKHNIPRFLGCSQAVLQTSTHTNIYLQVQDLLESQLITWQRVQISPGTPQGGSAWSGHHAGEATDLCGASSQGRSSRILSVWRTAVLVLAKCVKQHFSKL